MVGRRWHLSCASKESKSPIRSALSSSPNSVPRALALKKEPWRLGLYEFQGNLHIQDRALHVIALNMHSGARYVCLKPIIIALRMLTKKDWL